MLRLAPETRSELQCHNRPWISPSLFTVQSEAQHISVPGLRVLVSLAGSTSIIQSYLL